jgi:hypothetical protein
MREWGFIIRRIKVAVPLFPLRERQGHLSLPARLTWCPQTLCVLHGVQRRRASALGALAALAFRMRPALLAEQIGLSPSGASSWSKVTVATRGDSVGLRNH